MSSLRNAFLVCLLAAVLAPAASVDTNLLNLVMPDAKFISGIQVESAKNSPFGKYVLSQMQTHDSAFSQFVAETDFDPRRDLTEIVVGTAGTADQPLILVVGSGRFNPGAITSAAQAKGATVSRYNGIDILSHSGQHNSGVGALAFLGGNYAAIGTLDAVRGAIDRYKSGAVLPDSLSGKAIALSGVNDAWFLSTGPITDFFAGKVANAKVGNAMQANLMQAVLQANGGIKFGDTAIVISGEALTRSAKDATALADVVRFLAGMVQLNRDKDPNAEKVATLLDTLTLSTSDATVRLSMSMPESLVEQLFVPSSKPGARGHVKRAAR